MINFIYKAGPSREPAAWGAVHKPEPRQGLQKAACHSWFSGRVLAAGALVGEWERGVLSLSARPAEGVCLGLSGATTWPRPRLPGQSPHGGWAVWWVSLLFPNPNPRQGPGSGWPQGCVHTHHTCLCTYTHTHTHAPHVCTCTHTLSTPHTRRLTCTCTHTCTTLPRTHTCAHTLTHMHVCLHVLCPRVSAECWLDQGCVQTPLVAQTQCWSHQDRGLWGKCLLKGLRWQLSASGPEPGPWGCLAP